ncbi:MAG: acetate/propionate family kinase [Acidobacteriia bacterium]|nr:acetate/propionate family kinase [Terriglobia bacterium]
MKILALNGGSSTFKCWFHDLPGGPLPVEAPQPLWDARVEWNAVARIAAIRIRTARGAAAESTRPASSLVDPLASVLESLWTGDTAAIRSPREIDAVGHRIVHGGKAYRETTALTPEVRAAVAQQAEFAPSHNRFELEAVECVDRILGSGVRQIAVFDTAFHATLEPPAYVYPGPLEWLDQGIRRYGFHGINDQYATRRAAQILRAPVESLKLVVCHLGNGGSLAAVRGGKSVDTTMGFTPLEGLMMGTRSGSLDPGILIYLLRHRGYTADRLDQVLNRESGLLGVSGLSGDMREISAAMASGNARAQLAFDLYAHRLCQEAGAMLAVLGGADALVFTGGIGENCPPLRERLCRRLAFAGVQLDPDRNARNPSDADIAAPDSAVRVLVIHAEEEWEIARECRRLVEKQQSESL